MNSGFYPLDSNDSIEILIQAAGGTTISADHIIVLVEVLKRYRVK